MSDPFFTEEEFALAESAKAICTLLLRGTKPGGEVGYAYLLLSTAKIDAFLKAMTSGEKIELTQYGRVLLKGTGDPSSQEIENMYMNWLFSHRKTVLRLMPAEG